MPTRCHTFKLPRHGSSAAEYEDACARDEAAGRFSIADGASESFASGVWARLLVEEFVRRPLPCTMQWAAWLPPLQQRWLAEFNGQPLSWYAEAKIQEGAFAAFVGLLLQEPGWFGKIIGVKPSWRAVAVGDSCVFQIRQGQLWERFPVKRSEEFDNRPHLVGSRDGAADLVALTEGRGDCQTGDLLLLMTDALAQWFLRQWEAARKPWEAVETLLAGPATEADFANWVEGLREKRELRNDDVTLLAVRL